MLAPDQRPDLLAQPDRERRALAARRDGHGDVSRPMYGRRDEAAVRQVVHGVEQDATLLRFRPDVRVDAAVVGRGDREERALQVAAAVTTPPQFDRARRREVLEFPGEVGAHHGDARPRFEQAHHLLLRHGAATHHDAAPSLEMQEYRIEAHGHLVMPSP